MRKGDNTALIMALGVLVISGILMYPFLKTEEHTRSEKTQINADIVSRDLSNIIKLLAGVEQGVQFYELPRNTYEIELGPSTIRATDKDVNCERGCSFIYEHNSNYVQASHVLPGVENVCVVKKYENKNNCNYPLIYICDAEGKDLRCDCELGEIKDCINENRFSDEGKPCKLELLELDNYGEVGDVNTVSMTVNAKDCEGMYLSPFGMPYPEWEYGLDTPNDLEENEFKALRYKKTKKCVEIINPKTSEELEKCLKDDRNSRTIGDNENEKEITVEYVCKGKGNNFLFDLAAFPADDDYVIDTFARIQTIVGCGEKPKPHTCVDGCEVNEEECDLEKFGPGKFYCDRKGSVFANFCVDAYYDVNCIPN